MRPRTRGKKLHEEWAVPLKNVEDIYEVRFPTYLSYHLMQMKKLSINMLLLQLVCQRFLKYCLGKLKNSPWSELDGLQPETKIINEQLGNINSKGFLTINSQPAVNGAKSDSPSVG